MPALMPPIAANDQASAPLKILVEMRPALEGHAGIPQETRLLFRGLSLLDNTAVEGLIQGSDRVLAQGLPVNGRVGRLSRDRQLNRLGRVVISIEQGYWDSMPATYMHTFAMAVRHLLGGRQTLTRFDARQFKDYIWRRFFARTLPSADFDLVTGAAFRIARVPWNAMHICALVIRQLGGPSLFPRLDTSDFDMMIAETPFPATVSKHTKLVVRYHDAIPLLMPHTISDKRWHHAFHYYALRKNVASGAWFVCVSEATRQDLLSVFPQAEARSLTIHNMVSHNYFDENSAAERVPEIVKIRMNARVKPPLDATLIRRLFENGVLPNPLDYLLVVSTVEPRKNHLGLLSAWEKLRADSLPTLKLFVVGKLGWQHKAIVKQFRPWMERGDVFLLEDVPAADLRLLYKHAVATICPSFGEGFDYSGAEAMQSGGVVAASDIPVHREIYADAAEYFNPYSTTDLARAVTSLMGPANGARRAELVARGAVVAQRYAYETILPQWQAFLMAPTAATASTTPTAPTAPPRPTAALAQ
jgi:glycosyltransferase involved in cell wall biosynthesis